MFVASFLRRDLSALRADKSRLSYIDNYSTPKTKILQRVRPLRLQFAYSAREIRWIRQTKADKI
jgi:hypothetical protein